MFSRWRAAVAALGLCLSIVGCGGGGGGDDLKITLSQQSLTIDAEERVGGSGSVTATISGSYEGDVYVGADSSGSGIAYVDVSFDEARASVTVSVDPNLVAGTYTGNLRVLVCADAACQRHIGGSPFSVPYTVVVHPGLKTTPGYVQLESISGEHPDPIEVAVQLPDGVTDYSATIEFPIAEVVDKTAAGFKLRMLPVPSGYYDTRVTIEAAGGRSYWMPVTRVVQAPPGGEHGLIVGSDSVALVATEGSAGTPVKLDVTAPTWNPPLRTEVQYGNGDGWLQVVPTDGGYLLTGDASALPQGTYTAWLSIFPEATVGVNEGRSIGVSMTVGAGLVRPADRIINARAETVTAELSGGAPIRMAAGPERNWTAQSDAAWLRLDTASGLTGSELRYHVDQSRLSSMANGTSQTGTITVRTDLDTIASVSFQVTLDKRLPEVRFAAPFAQPSGRANTVLVRGVGFSSVDNLSARLSVQGVPGATATLVSDTEISLLVPAATPVGSHVVSITNAMGLAVASNRFTLYEPTTFAYARLPQVGAKRGLQFDPLTRSLFTVNFDQRAALRYTFNGTQWSGQNRAIASVSNVGLSPDGTTLVAISDNGLIRLLDPQTLATRSAHDRGSPFVNGPNLSYGPAITNDGQVWLGVGEGWNQLETFDLTAQQYRPVVIEDVPTDFYDGPWFNVSRNGERLVITQSGGITRPMLYLDARDGRVKQNQGGINAFYDVSQSDDGQRLMLEKGVVYDGDYAMIGRTHLPDPGYFAVGAALSPDGRRAYVLAYREYYTTDQSIKPRVYVFDSTQAPLGGASLPVLGHFEVADYATCMGDYWECPATTVSTIAPDGRTLFFAGHDALLVVPVPSNHQSAQAVDLRKRAQQQRERRPASGIMQHWSR